MYPTPLRYTNTKGKKNDYEKKVGYNWKQHIHVRDTHSNVNTMVCVCCHRHRRLSVKLKILMTHAGRAEPAIHTSIGTFCVVNISFIFLYTHYFAHYTHYIDNVLTAFPRRRDVAACLI